MDVTQLLSTWVGWPNGEKLALTYVQIWSRPKWTQVIASQRKCARKAWPSGVTSRPKFSTCVFHVALQISTHAFVRESIKNGSFVFADELQYSDISINMSLFTSITMMSWLSNTRVECVCCSRSQPHAFSWLYYVNYAEECKRVAHVAPWLTERLEEAYFNKPTGRIKIPIHFNYGNLFYNTCSNSRMFIGLF